MPDGTLADQFAIARQSKNEAAQAVRAVGPDEAGCTATIETVSPIRPPRLVPAGLNLQAA